MKTNDFFNCQKTPCQETARKPTETIERADAMLDWIDRMLGRPSAEMRIRDVLSHSEWKSASELAAAAGAMWSGRIYPVLMRLERDGVVESIWMPGVPYPRPRLYRLKQHAGS